MFSSKIIKFAILSLLLDSFILYSGCSFISYEKDELLYSDANNLLNSAMNEAESYAKAYDFYMKAKQNIEILLSEYKSSHITNNIISGDKTISGLSLGEFQKMEGALKPLAEAEQDFISCALLIANSIEDESVKAKTLLKAVDSFTNAKYIENALQIVRMIENINISKDRSLRDIAYIAVKNGLFQQAYRAAKAIENKYDKAITLADISTWNREKNLTNDSLKILEQALEEAKTTEDIYSKAVTLAYIGTKYFEAGQNDKSLSLLSRALETATKNEFSSGSNYVKEELLSFIVRQYAEIKQFSKALEIANTLENDNRSMDNALATIVENLADENQFARALEITNTIRNKEIKAESFIYIAGKYLDTGKNEKAYQILTKALEIAKETLNLANISIKFADLRKFAQALNIAKSINDDRALGYISIKYASTEHYKKAVETAMIIKDVEKKADVLGNIASRYIESGNCEKANIILSQALNIVININTIILDSSKDRALEELALKFTDAGNISKAVEITESIKDQYSRVRTLTGIVGNLKLPDSDGIKENLLAKALEIANTIQEDPFIQMLSLADIREQYTMAGKEENVTQVLSQMLENIITLKFSGDKALFLVDLAIEYERAGHELTDDDTGHLQKMVQHTYPIKQFWENNGL